MALVADEIVVAGTSDRPALSELCLPLRLPVYTAVPLLLVGIVPFCGVVVAGGWVFLLPLTGTGIYVEKSGMA